MTCGFEIYRFYRPRASANIKRVPILSRHNSNFYDPKNPYSKKLGIINKNDYLLRFFQIVFNILVEFKLILLHSNEQQIIFGKYSEIKVYSNLDERHKWNNVSFSKILIHCQVFTSLYRLPYF